jgi:hypothetical protein
MLFGAKKGNIQVIRFMICDFEGVIGRAQPPPPRSLRCCRLNGYRVQGLAGGLCTSLRLMPRVA